MPIRDEQDIFTFARQRVDNKGIGSRIKNSARFHSLRSALSSKGSAGSKALSVLAMGARSAFKLIPIPIVGDLLGQAQKGVASYARGKFLSKRKNEATKAANAEDMVKFDLKELSVENLDRFRWKLRDAVTELNAKAAGFNALLNDKWANDKPCHAFLELAEAIAQAERRQYKLTKQCQEMIDSLQGAVTWANGMTAEIARFKTQYSAQFAAHITAEIANAQRVNAAQADAGSFALWRQHQSCEHYCYVRDIAETDDWATTRAKAAELVNLLTTPFEVEAFLSLDGSAFKQADAPAAPAAAPAPSSSSAKV